MSNRTDFANLANELLHAYSLELQRRVETELHNAYVAGQEARGCMCSHCAARRGITKCCYCHGPLNGNDTYCSDECVIADAKRLRPGCGRHSCRVRKPTGQATNGPCQCPRR